MLKRADLDGDLASIATRLQRSTVQVMSRGGHGSGLIASPDGSVVTNAHVASGRSARVVLSDGRDLRGEVTSRAPDRDLAALRLDATNLPAAEFRDARALRAGDVVIAVGNPLDLIGAIATGIVHSADRRGRRVVADLQLLPGNSGGPLADSSGRVVGVNAMVVDGLAIAIGSTVVTRFLSPAIKPHVGVATHAVSVPVMGQKRLGLLIMDVSERSPASRAGVLTGDVLIGVDGRLFQAPDDLQYELESSTVGASVRFDVLRAGRVDGIEVTLGSALQGATAA